MHSDDQNYLAAVDLYWIAFLITACPNRAADVALNELQKGGAFLSEVPMLRRAVIAGAVAAMRGDLALSSTALEYNQVDLSDLPSREWSLDPNTGKDQVQEALLAIDVFPRCALLLTVFENFAIDDVAALLNADIELIRRGRIVGLFELTRNLASAERRTYQRSNIRDIRHQTQCG